MTIKTRWDRDMKGRACIIIEKSKGKLTIEEVQKAVNPIHDGWTAIILRTGDDLYNGFMDEEEPKGDTIMVFPLEESEGCPVCGQIPPLDRLYCPECGNRMKEVSE